MTRDVTKSGGGLVEAPKLSPELQKILQRRKVVPDYGGDEGVSVGGGNFRDGVWDAPEWVDARERDEARQKVSQFEAFLRPVTAERIREFLLFLWNSTKHQNDTSWEAVAAVYPMMLDGHPSWCFRPERLKLAAQNVFDWFPTVRQLAEFMEPDRQAILQRVEALRKVSETSTSPPKEAGRGGLRPWAEGGMEDSMRWERERVDRERKELIEIMRKRDEEAGLKPADTAVPARLPGEGDKAYVSRLVAHTRDQIDLGAAARRRDEERQRNAADEKVRTAYGRTGIKPEDVRTADKTEQNAMSGSER